MPFASKAQQRYFYANRKKLERQGVDVGEWAAQTDFSKLPERAKQAAAGNTTRYVMPKDTPVRREIRQKRRAENEARAREALTPAQQEQKTDRIVRAKAKPDVAPAVPAKRPPTNPIIEKAQSGINERAKKHLTLEQQLAETKKIPIKGSSLLNSCSMAAKVAANLTGRADTEAGKATLAKWEAEDPEGFRATVAKGLKVEMEHTKDRDVAEQITRDHLTESREYYNELAKMEDRMKKAGEAPFAVFVIAPTGNGRFAATTRAADRAKEDAGVRIGLPGGKVDPGEAPHAAAVREAAEEGWTVHGLHPEPVHREMVQGKPVWWYAASGAKKLDSFKEQHRITPVEAKHDELNGFGNEGAMAAWRTKTAAVSPLAAVTADDPTARGDQVHIPLTFNPYANDPQTALQYENGYQFAQELGATELAQVGEDAIMGWHSKNRPWREGFAGGLTNLGRGDLAEKIMANKTSAWILPGSGYGVKKVATPLPRLHVLRPDGTSNLDPRTQREPIPKLVRSPQDAKARLAALGGRPPAKVASLLAPAEFAAKAAAWHDQLDQLAGNAQAGVDTRQWINRGIRGAAGGLIGHALSQIPGVGGVADVLLPLAGATAGAMLPQSNYSREAAQRGAALSLGRGRLGNAMGALGHAVATPVVDAANLVRSAVAGTGALAGRGMQQVAPPMYQAGQRLETAATRGPIWHG